MASSSKSDQRKHKQLNIVPKPKQKWQVKKPKRDWLELPSDVTANILHRIGFVDILQNAQKVCTAWRKICKDPDMWRVICMDDFSDIFSIGMDNFADLDAKLKKMCKHVVDRSQGKLVDITIKDFGDDELLMYVAHRSSQLRRLKIACSFDYTYKSWTEALKKFPMLEELSLNLTKISKEGIESAGRCCPMLKTLKLNKVDWNGPNDEIAMAIAENLHELRHLELIGNSMTNAGLQKILDGCSQLESLDLRRCLYIALEGDIGKRCSEQIKCLKLPQDSLEGCPYMDVYYTSLVDCLNVFVDIYE